MIRLLIDLSRYLFVFNLFIFLLIGYVYLLKKEEKRKSFLLFIQAFLIFANHMIGSFCLMASRMSLNYLIFPVVEIVIILSFIVLMQAFYPEASRLLTNDLGMLLSIGLTVLTRLYYDKAIKQFIIICIGMVVCLIIPALFKRKDIFLKARYIMAGAGFLLLASVLIQKQSVNGSILNLTIGEITFQPSELVKILFVLMLTALLVKATKFIHFLLITVISFSYVLVLAYTKDLGTAVIFYGTFVIVFFIATKKKRILGIGAMLAILSSVAAYFMFSHVRTRVSVWLNPWADIDSKGYQTTQSLFAICSGNFFGFGLDKGAPLTIPYVDQDFIFSAICEELGTVFGLLFILLCLNFFIETINIAKSNNDKFYHLCGTGFGILYLIQVILTIGGNINFIPMTGVTLQFISYGGSSVLCSLIMFGFIQSIAITRIDNYEEIIPSFKHLNIAELAFSLITICMTVYLAVFVYSNRGNIITNSYNAKRMDIIEESITRGDIKSSDGEILATTLTKNGTEYRYYPFENIFSHVVGYDSLGGLGIEKDYSVTLMTSSISVSQWVDDDLNSSKHVGNTVNLTIDSRLQEACYKALGVYEGAIVVLNPETGEILAMVSKPDFDPNTISENWEELISDTANSCLVNRVTSGLYPPGSTFKILTALEYLKENNNDISGYSFNCNGSFTYDGNTIKCYHGSNHGEVDFEKSFAKSCNSSFANIGLSLDFDSFTDTLDEFYFGKSLNLDFDTKVSSYSDADSSHNIMQTSIGQGETLITPLHLAMITATIANDGVMQKPFLVSSVNSSDGKVISKTSVTSMGTLMTSEQAAILKELMIDVVQEGTATKLKDQEVKVAGKTGSAEYKTNSSDSHAWFTCFTYDTDNPIVVTVIMEGAGSGGEYACPVARQVLDTYYNTIITE